MTEPITNELSSGDISIVAVKALQKQLKSYSRNWVYDLIPKMQTTLDEDPETTKQRIYNVCTGVIKANDMRLRFIEKGVELAKIYQKRYGTVVKAATQLEQDSISSSSK